MYSITYLLIMIRIQGYSLAILPKKYPFIRLMTFIKFNVYSRAILSKEYSITYLLIMIKFQGYSLAILPKKYPFIRLMTFIKIQRL